MLHVDYTYKIALLLMFYFHQKERLKNEKKKIQNWLDSFSITQLSITSRNKLNYI